jgi:hypothetical protein
MQTIPYYAKLFPELPKLPCDLVELALARIKAGSIKEVNNHLVHPLGFQDKKNNNVSIEDLWNAWTISDVDSLTIDPNRKELYKKLKQQLLDIDRNQSLKDIHDIDRFADWCFRQNGFDRHYTKLNGQQFLTRPTIRFGLKDELGGWISENISDNFYDVSVSRSDDPYDGSFSDTQGPHTDHTRHHALLYILDQSNTDQDIVYWQEEGHDLYRERNTRGFDYNKLREVYRLRVPVNTWYLVEGLILHSVENIKGVRTIIHASFEDLPNRLSVR